MKITAWIMVPVFIISLLVGGCKFARNLSQKIADKIDVDISIDYIKTNSEGREKAISIADFDNVEELLLFGEK